MKSNIWESIFITQNQQNRPETLNKCDFFQEFIFL